MPYQLMSEIRAFRVPEGAVALWWLGQMGYIFKSPQGTLAGVDLYLTDSCAMLSSELDLKRRVPVLIEPEELEVDVFACTHNHQDHTDPETIRRLRIKDSALFAGPPPSGAVFRAEGIAEDRIVMAWPDCEIRCRDLVIRGAYAVPTDDTDLNHLGYVFQYGDGPKIYLTGDTDWSERLCSAAKHAPEVMIACINTGFNNLSHWEAAELAARLKPKVAIPCHYDLFADNAADPRQFRAALLARAPGVRYVELEHGQAWVFGPGTAG